jgi:hypothetical protein
MSRVHLARGRGAAGKTIVMGMKERGGRIVTESLRTSARIRFET